MTFHVSIDRASLQQEKYKFLLSVGDCSMYALSMRVTSEAQT